MCDDIMQTTGIRSGWIRKQGDKTKTKLCLFSKDKSLFFPGQIFQISDILYKCQQLWLILLFVK